MVILSFFFLWEVVIDHFEIADGLFRVLIFRSRQSGLQSGYPIGHTVWYNRGGPRISEPQPAPVAAARPAKAVIPKAGAMPDPISGPFPFLLGTDTIYIPKGEGPDP